MILTAVMEAKTHSTEAVNGAALDLHEKYQRG
jgi:hypothetical protein